jgi:hypothetical protein
MAVRRTRGGGYRYDPYTGVEVGTRQGGIASLPMPGTSNLYNTVAPSVGSSPVAQRDFDGPMRYKEANPSVPNMTATAGMSLPGVGGQAASYRNPTTQAPKQMPGWVPADILNPPGGGNVSRTRQAVLDRRENGGGYRSQSNGQRGWKPIGMNITTQSHLSGPGTGQYFPGTASEDKNRQTQQRVDAFLAEAQRVGAPLSQINAGVAAIKSGGSLPSGFGSGGGGGMNNPMVQDVISQYQDALNKSNAANERRYQDILAGKWALLQKQLADMQGLGQQEITDTNLGFDAQKADVLQSMVDRGLSNTTVQNTMQSGVDERRQHEINRINERLKREQIELERGLQNDMMGFMERKTENGPDLSQMLALLQAFGASGGGGGGGASSLPPLLAGGPVFMDAGAMGFGNPMAALAQLNQPMSYRNSGGSTPASAAAARRAFNAGRAKPPTGPGSYGWGVDLAPSYGGGVYA